MMNYVIPEEEKKNLISVYWQMLRELESRVEHDRVGCSADVNLIEGHIVC